MINNRQAGRRRGRGGGNNGPRQGGNQGNGSRIDNRARGNAAQLHEKYKNMAADAQRAGDRVNTEYYLQFADHYFRVLSEQRGRFEDQQQPRRGRDDFDLDGDEEFGDEGEPIRGNEQDARDDRPQRDDRYREGNAEGRGEGRPREFRRDRDGSGDTRGEPRGGEGRRERGEWQDRGEGRGEGRRERRPEQPPVEIAGQRRAEPLAPGESLEHRAEEVLEADRPLDAPARRRGRPRREAGEALGGDVNGGGEALGIDRLPPSLSGSLSVAANDEAPGEAKPRRRRARPAEDTPTAAE